MELSNIKKIIDFGIRNSGDYLHVVLSCGEPLLHKNFEEIFLYCYQKDLSIGVTTNGTLINDELVRLLKKTNKVFVSISLDSYNKEKYGKFR
ncbi:MAG: radical SAM protein [Lachnospirales bacterium]